MTEKPVLLNAIYTNSAFFPMHQESEMASRKSSGSAKPLFAQVPPLPFTLHIQHQEAAHKQSTPQGFSPGSTWGPGEPKIFGDQKKMVQPKKILKNQFLNILSFTKKKRFHLHLIYMISYLQNNLQYKYIYIYKYKYIYIHLKFLFLYIYI